MAKKVAKVQPVTLENVRIAFRNFSGKAGKYNAEGVRGFAAILPHHVGDQLLEQGWNIKYLKPRDEEELPQPYLPVAINFDGARPPRVVMVTSRGRTTLGEGEIDILDWADISNVDLIVNPYDWDVNGNVGRKAYLGSVFVTIVEDELELKYADVPDSAQNTMRNTGTFDQPPWN